MDTNPEQKQTEPMQTTQQSPESFNNTAWWNRSKFRLIIAVVFVSGVLGILGWVLWKNFLVETAEKSPIAQAEKKTATQEAKIEPVAASAENDLVNTGRFSDIKIHKNWNVYVDDSLKYQIQFPESFAVLRMPVGVPNNSSTEVEKVFFGAGQDVEPPFSPKGVGILVVSFVTDKAMDSIISSKAEAVADNSPVAIDYQSEHLPSGKQLTYQTSEGYLITRRIFPSPSFDKGFFEIWSIVDKTGEEKNIKLAEEILETFRVYK